MKTILVVLMTLCFNVICYGQLRLHRLLSDNVVLQRGMQLELKGWSAPDEIVTLRFGNQTFSSSADHSGKWTILLSPQHAGGPHEFRFSGDKEDIVIKNILFGDVWLCSGQSNMEMLMNNVKDKYADVIAKSENSNIRHFRIPQNYDFNEEHDSINGGEWKVCSPENVLQFSAVAYFFAKEIYEKYGIPIGLLNATVGGAPAQSWISEASLAHFPHYLEEAHKFRDKNLIEKIEKDDQERIRQWYANASLNDEGVKGKWSSPNFNDSSWPEMSVPGYWSDKGMIEGNGVVWFRRTFDVNASNEGKKARLFLGRMVDHDSVFVNGEFVGTTTYQYPQRRYYIKDHLLKEGRNTIAIKIINQSGKGGFVPGKPYLITIGNDSIDLHGQWKYNLGTKMEPLASQTFIRWKPLGLYNAMIAPVTWFRTKGVIWYQGESNIEKPEEYKALLPTLIANWREKWKDDFPFIFVQLPNYSQPCKNPCESDWAQLRQAELETLKHTPKTGMAVTIDVGEWNDIHPLSKAPVGKRLALNAMKIAYGDKDLTPCGPVAVDATFGKKYVIVKFENGKSGLMIKGDKQVHHIAISSDGKSFVWAKAVVHGNNLRVWNDQISNPVVVRYAWADNPESANLYNEEGLPASPFEFRK